jgi:2-C-methyl-D-erythritol 4-phosphate cytidylyltransferase
MNAFHVIIPAAGSGSRMATEAPKQYLPLLGATLIETTLRVFMACNRLASINVVLSPHDRHWDEHCSALNPHFRVLRCGGETRAVTVLNGLQALVDEIDEQDWVLVHDAARPGLTVDLLNRLLDALQNDEVGGLLAIPLADTLKRADSEQRVVSTEPRDHLWQAQTPQMFRYGLLKRALIQSGGAPTDEAQAVEVLGLQPKLVVGELRNLKITYPQDLAIAEAILSADTQLSSKKEKR